MNCIPINVTLNGMDSELNSIEQIPLNMKTGKKKNMKTGRYKSQ